ncbi:ferroptosis suppressor protein 1 isoform 6-T6 [Menidia menidia]
MPDPVVCLLCVCCVSVVCLCSMGSGPSLPEGVQVVVVGGGFGGVAVCQQLRALGLSFSLVDTRDAFHHNVAALRAAVQPGFARRTFIPYAETFGDAFVQGRVDRIDPDRQRVVLMGGRVVLVHSRVALADPDLEPSVRQQAKEVLLEKGVELLLGQKVQDLAALRLNVTQRGQTVRTDRETLTTDLVLICTGTRVNASAYASSLSGSMAPGGALRVNAFLQVDGFSNVFAVGDCAHLPEPKLAYGAQRHAATAAANIHRSLRGEELIAYRPGNVTMLLAMGPDDGVGQLNGVRLPRCLVALGKSRDLLLWKSWREMGQKQP